MSATQLLGIPPGKTAVGVSIIDTTLDADLPVGPFLAPNPKGFDLWHVVAYAFLITHTDSDGKQRRVVFDLGCPTDPENDFPPPVAQGLKDMGGRVEAKKYTSEILTDHGVSLESIEGMIWSHAHLDHVGRPSLFPPSTSLIVGPGIKSSFFPGYPAVQDSPVLAREFEGRSVRELEFTTGLRIGGFDAIDYFGDGSFFLLSAPGHAVGHLNALARTTENTFIYCAGDSFHHGSLLRPHADARLPREVVLPGGVCCSGQAFHRIHPLTRSEEVIGHYSRVFKQLGDDPDETPFCTIPETPSGQPILALDLQQARDTVKLMQKFDASPDVFVICAHDASLCGVLDFFPHDGNHWQERGWKEQGRWRFLHDFAGLLET